MKSYRGYITKLLDNQVFVFGSNFDGFHGAGSAGYASFNVSGNHWREFEYDKKPYGWQGKWNIKGISEGFQQGEIGKSYAIPTVVRAGMKCSRTPAQIILSIKKFYGFAQTNPQFDFLVAQENKIGLNGYTPEQMASMWKSMIIPDNVYFNEDFIKLL